jgi:hypothetical protein
VLEGAKTMLASTPPSAASTAPAGLLTGARRHLRTVVVIYPDGRVMVPFASYAGSNSGIPIEALTSEAFRASANVLFGFSGTEKQARTTPGWLRLEVEDDLFAFIQSVASAYAEAGSGDPLQ